MANGRVDWEGDDRFNPKLKPDELAIGMPCPRCKKVFVPGQPPVLALAFRFFPMGLTHDIERRVPMPVPPETPRWLAVCRMCSAANIELHECSREVTEMFPGRMDAHAAWVARGFGPPEPTPMSRAELNRALAISNRIVGPSPESWNLFVQWADARYGLEDMDPGAKLSSIAMNFAFEAAEVGDLIKKNVFHLHEPDEAFLAKLQEELGDAMYGFAMILKWYGIDFHDVLRACQDKLNALYPEGFDPVLSQKRREAKRDREAVLAEKLAELTAELAALKRHE